MLGRFQKYQIKSLLIFTIIAIVSFSCGVLVGAAKYPPYEMLREVKQTPSVTIPSNEITKTNSADDLTEVNPVYYETDVNSLIQIQNELDLVLKRKKLIEFLWGSRGFPDSKLPVAVQEGITDERYADLNNLQRIDQITVVMDYGLNSIIYHFIPAKSKKELVIYHHGHRGDFFAGKDVIAFFLDKGYSVMAMSMPLLGMNNKPMVYLERFGRIEINEHEQLKFLALEDGHPVRFFLEPVAIALNYAEKYEFSSINLVGLSGGGWTTTLYAAVDPRILRSYSVAGSLPIYLRSGEPRDWGDYEQTVPEVYEIANYLELYILAAYGNNRKHVQILNKYDPCCFAAAKSATYESAVRHKMDILRTGAFEVYVDDSHKEHEISNQALPKILDDIQRR